MTLCRKTDKQNLEPNQVEIQAYLQTDKSIAIELKLAPDSHAYLDRGLEGNLIPIEFDWKPFLQSKILSVEPQLLVAPVGEYEKKVKASVLRGKGRFLFEGPSLKKLLGKKLRVRTQVCDEVQNICYRPEWKSIFIRDKNIDG